MAVPLRVFEWSLLRDWLLVIGSNPGNGVQALPPVGPPSRAEVSRMLLAVARETRDISEEPRIDRADARLAAELEGERRLSVRADEGPLRLRLPDGGPDQPLGQGLPGETEPPELPVSLPRVGLRADHGGPLEACLGLAEDWCVQRRCEEDLNLIGEGDATREALMNFEASG